jgi:hypothetical protein
MISSARLRVPRFSDLLLFVAGNALPVVLYGVGAGTGIVLLAVVLTAVVWMTVWNDLGFLLGGFLFWITMIITMQATVAPGQVDNMLPGLAVPFGWVPYVMLVGPLFLILKSVRRLQEALSLPRSRSAGRLKEEADEAQQRPAPHHRDA